MKYKRKIININFIKFKNFLLFPKIQLRRLNGKPNTWKTFLPHIYSTKELYPEYSKNAYFKKNKKTQLNKWAKDINSDFTKEYTRMSHKNMKSCSISLAIWEMQIKVTVRYHFTPTRMALTKNTEQASARTWRNQTPHTLLVGR